jgi:hypothetical protein
MSAFGIVIVAYCLKVRGYNEVKIVVFAALYFVVLLLLVAK